MRAECNSTLAGLGALGVRAELAVGLYDNSIDALRLLFADADVCATRVALWAGACGQADMRAARCARSGPGTRSLRWRGLQVWWASTWTSSRRTLSVPRQSLLPGATFREADSPSRLPSGGVCRLPIRQRGRLHVAGCFVRLAACAPCSRLAARAADAGCGGLVAGAQQLPRCASAAQAGTRA
jgi:hypothetical protein